MKHLNKTECVCVCHPWSHRDAFAFDFVLQQGVQAAHPVLHQRRHWMCAGDIDLGRQIDVPAVRETYVELKLSTSLFPSLKGYCSGDEFGFSARTSSPCRPLDR